MGIAVLLLLIAVVWLRYGAGGRHRARVDGAIFWALRLGVLGFALGFFGPMLLAPDANQGPLLGIFITGPLGFLVGLVWGIWRGKGGVRE